MSLFADNTTILGRADEIEQGSTCIKRIMEAFEERNNVAKEVVNFGDDNSANVRMLGCWLDPKVDVQNRIKRAGKLWARVRPQLVNSKMTKRQALVVQTCVESGLLFDVATRSWQKGENKLQQWIDRRYRYVWGHKKEPPLKTMQRVQKNMQDVRSSLGVKSIHWKVELRSLQRIGYVMRMSNDRPTKKAILVWPAKG